MQKDTLEEFKRKEQTKERIDTEGSLAVLIDSGTFPCFVKQQGKYVPVPSRHELLLLARLLFWPNHFNLAHLAPTTSHRSVAKSGRRTCGRFDCEQRRLCNRTTGKKRKEERNKNEVVRLRIARQIQSLFPTPNCLCEEEINHRKSLKKDPP